MPGFSAETSSSEVAALGSGILNSAQAERIAAQLVRALRGRRSCAEHSRRLGYASNSLRRWESRESFPTASAFFSAHARLQPNARVALAAFLKRDAAHADAAAPFAPAALARM